MEDVSGNEDEAGLNKSADALKALIDAEADGTGNGLNGQHINPDRIVVGGFSQVCIVHDLLK